MQNMHEYANICNKYALIYKYMHKICKNMQKYAKYAQNMQIKYAKNMHKCAKIIKHVKYLQGSLCHRNMQKHANFMQATYQNMQNMQSRFAYAKYAKIRTPDFADVLQVW